MAKIDGVKVFYAKHSEVLENEMNEWIEGYGSKYYIVDVVAKLRVDRDGKPHFLVLVFYRD